MKVPAMRAHIVKHFLLVAKKTCGGRKTLKPKTLAPDSPRKNKKREEIAVLDGVWPNHQP